MAQDQLINDFMKYKSKKGLFDKPSIIYINKGLLLY